MQRKTLAAAIALGACALAVAGSAAASPGKDPQPGAPSSEPLTGKLAAPASADALLGRKPPGYVQVTGAAVTIGAGFQERATVSCPVGKVPAGGGGVVASSDVRANINSSLPFGNGWAIDVNNATGASTTASARVICIKPPRKYVVISVGDLNLSSTETAGTAFCPTGTVVLGGGAESNAVDLRVNLNSSFPLSGGNGWRTDTNNGSPSDQFVTTFAICAKQPRGYAVVRGADVNNHAGAESSAFASCAGNAVPLGGGPASFADDLQVNINSLRPEAHGWTSFENNASPFAASLSTRVVCAGV
jgi:hypothetical protein